MCRAYSAVPTEANANVAYRSYDMSSYDSSTKKNQFTVAGDLIFFIEQSAASAAGPFKN